MLTFRKCRCDTIKQLSKAAEQVLSKGFNYAIAPNRLPVEKIVCGVENAISILEPNIEELKALIEFKRDENTISILPADKSNATVVPNTRDYKDKMQKLLDDPTYKPITTDPTTHLEKTTRTKINTTSLSEETKKSITPREKSSKYPKTYGLRKIHKQDVSLRPMVYSIGSTQALARYLTNQLKSYGEQMTSYVKNTDHFVDILHQQHVESTGIQRNRQTGAQMGSPLSPIIANIIVEDFETRALDTVKYKPKPWLRCVDDIFII
ncbi:hypothetical protein Trydic_g12901 [Trypoxylus dichotomus]